MQSTLESEFLRKPFESFAKFSSQTKNLPEYLCRLFFLRHFLKILVNETLTELLDHLNGSFL